MTTRQAVVDRFEEEWAVLIFSDNQEILNVPRAKLPRRVREGHVLSVILEDGELTKVVIDREATKQAKQRIQEKLARLRRGDHLKS